MTTKTSTSVNPWRHRASASRIHGSFSLVEFSRKPTIATARSVRLPGSGTGLICKAADKTIRRRPLSKIMRPAPTVSSIHRLGTPGGQDQRTRIHGRATVISVRAAEDQHSAAVFGKRHTGAILADAARKHQAAASGDAGIQVVRKRQGSRDRVAAAHHRQSAVAPELSKVSVPPVPGESV